MRKMMIALTLALILAPGVASAQSFEKKDYNYSEWTKGLFSEAVTVTLPGAKMVFLAGVGAAWLFLSRPPAAVPAPRAAAEYPHTPPASPKPQPAVAVPSRPERRHRNSEGARPRGNETGPASSSGAAPPAVIPIPREPAAVSPPPGEKTYVRVAKLGDQTIELGGIVFSESNPVALINGKVASPGSVVGDYTVVRIRPEGVDFSGDGLVFSILLR